MGTAPKCPGCQRTEVGFEFAPIHSERDGHLLIVYGGQCGCVIGCAWRPTVQHLEEKPLTSIAKHGEIWQTKSRADIEYCLKATLDRSGAELERLKKRGWVRQLFNSYR